MKDSSNSPRLVILGTFAAAFSVILAVLTAYYSSVESFMVEATATAAISQVEATATAAFIPVSTHTPTLTATSMPTYTPSPTPTLSLIECNLVSFYGFESGVMGWQAQTQKSQAVLKVQQSNVRARSGNGSLELQIDLRGGTENNASGEAFVDLRYNAPLGFEVSPEEGANLQGIPIAIWVYIPNEAVGDLNRPNGVQVFVKDLLGRSMYGKWHSLKVEESTDTWIAVSLAPAQTLFGEVRVTPGFDPTKIILIGIKIGVGDGSEATYTGSIWIDDVCWPIP